MTPNILIIGAGGVGGFYGAKLAKVGVPVTLLARGTLLKTLQTRPLQVSSYQGDFEASVSVIESLEDLSAPPDVIIFCVKTYDTDAVIEQVRPFVAPTTTLFSLQNGVENEFKMTAAFSVEKVLGAVCYIGAEMVEPGKVLHSAKGTIALGELDGTLSQRVQDIVTVFQQADVMMYASDKIRNERWMKLCWNAAFNQVCTVARADVGQVLDSPQLKSLLDQAMKEVQSIAAVYGVTVTDDQLKLLMSLSENELRAVRPSMLQDFERGKRLEHETFSGFLSREGKKRSISTPLNDHLYAFLSFMSVA